MNSMGLAVRRPFRARHPSQNSGARPSKKSRIFVQRHFTKLVIPHQVHAVVEAGDLGIALKHECLALPESPQPPFSGLAPTRMIAVGIYVGIETVLVGGV